MVDYYPLTASLTLFANILQNPRDPQALSDIELMKSVTTFLSGFFDDKSYLESTLVIKIFLEVNRLAAEYVEKCRMQGTQAPKRGRGDSRPSLFKQAGNTIMRSIASPATPSASSRSVSQVC